MITKRTIIIIGCALVTMGFSSIITDRLHLILLQLGLFFITIPFSLE